MPEGLDLAQHESVWNGPTYYDRPQLKPAPFNESLVGGYVFLAGLSGGAQVLATLLDVARGSAAAGVVRSGRLIAMLAPVIGSVLLIADLHTPKRFYNMLRVFKRTSPMSIGSWILSAFSGFSGLTLIGDLLPGRPGKAARLLQVPAAAAGAGMGSYTASLLSATSTPLWAASPRALSVRFAASSIATAAAALSLCTGRASLRRDLDTLCIGALAVELAASTTANETYHRTGVDQASSAMETVGGTGLGVLLPLGLLTVATLTGSRSRSLSGAAACAVLTGSLMMRIGFIKSGKVSSARPDISLRFTKGNGA